MHLWQSTLGIALCTAAASHVPAQTPRPARVDIELATEPGGPPTAAQQWYKTLTDLNVDSLRLRAAAKGEAAQIKASGPREAPVYKVLGIVNRAGELALPGGRYRPTDKTRLSEWLTKLRQEGPERARGGPRLPYGLTKEEFGEVHEDLSRPISFATQGLKPAEFVHQAADVIQYPLTGTAADETQLRAAEPLDVELRGMAAGTALAFVLRQANLALVPQLDARRRPKYKLASLRNTQEKWPVGEYPQAPKNQLVPELFDMVDVELTDVEAPRVLGAIREHVPVPMLIDRAELSRAKIDLNEIKVTMPAKRSMYSMVLNKVLVPKNLSHEVRVDEANKPFLWITTARQAAAEQPPAKEPAR